jgi:hypothetical protein
MTSQPQLASADLIKVPTHYWDRLLEEEGDTWRRNALAESHPKGLIVRFLNADLLLDRQDRCLRYLKGNRWETFSYPLLELISLVFLLNASPDSPDGTLVSVAELKTAHFFQGPHELKVGSLIKRYGHDIKGFRESAALLGGKAQEMADAAYKLPALPKVPLYYLLWEGDEEFGPHLSILFDRTVEQHLPADGIWGLVSLVSDALLRGRLIP